MRLLNNSYVSACALVSVMFLSPNSNAGDPEAIHYPPVQTKVYGGVMSEGTTEGGLARHVGYFTVEAHFPDHTILSHDDSFAAQTTREIARKNCNDIRNKIATDFSRYIANLENCEALVSSFYSDNALGIVTPEASVRVEFIIVGKLTDQNFLKAELAFMKAYANNPAPKSEGSDEKTEYERRKNDLAWLIEASENDTVRADLYRQLTSPSAMWRRYIEVNEIRNENNVFEYEVTYRVKLLEETLEKLSPLMEDYAPYATLQMCEDFVANASNEIRVAGDDYMIKFNGCDASDIGRVAHEVTFRLPKTTAGKQLAYRYLVDRYNHTAIRSANPELAERLKAEVAQMTMPRDSYFLYQVYNEKRNAFAKRGRMVGLVDLNQKRIDIEFRLPITDFGPTFNSYVKGRRPNLEKSIKGIVKGACLFEMTRIKRKLQLKADQITVNLEQQCYGSENSDGGFAGYDRVYVDLTPILKTGTPAQKKALNELKTDYERRERVRNRAESVMTTESPTRASRGARGHL